MKCKNCFGDITAWLLKYKNTQKVRLDDLYFKDEKINPKHDENGLFITGERFYEHESKRCIERCPKCGAKDSMIIDSFEVTWAPI
jgi:hypothetical protein